MRSLIRIQPEGKVNGGDPRSLAQRPGADTIDSKVVLIQAMIPPSLQAEAEGLEEEVTVFAGPQYRRTSGRRTGSIDGSQCVARGGDAAATPERLSAFASVAGGHSQGDLAGRGVETIPHGLAHDQCWFRISTKNGIDSVIFPQLLECFSWKYPLGG